MFFGYTATGRFKKIAISTAITAVGIALLIQPCLPLLAAAQGDIAAQGQWSGSGHNTGGIADDSVAYHSGSSGQAGGEMVCCDTWECADEQISRILPNRPDSRLLNDPTLFALPSLDNSPGYRTAALPEPEFFHAAIFPTVSLSLRFRSLLI